MPLSDDLITTYSADTGTFDHGHSSPSSFQKDIESTTPDDRSPKQSTASPECNVYLKRGSTDPHPHTHYFRRHRPADHTTSDLSLTYPPRPPCSVDAFVCGLPSRLYRMIMQGASPREWDRCLVLAIVAIKSAASSRLSLVDPALAPGRIAIRPQRAGPGCSGRAESPADHVIVR